MAKKKPTVKVTALEQAMSMEVVKKDSRAVRIRGCGGLMSNQEEWEYVLESAGLGASLSTIEAGVGLREGTFKEWLDKGRDPTQKVYANFRKELLKAIAEARRLAEGIMLQKNPEKWLERNSAARAVETVEVMGNGGGSGDGGMEIAGKLVEAIQVLLDQGYSMEQIARDRERLVDGRVTGRNEEGG